MNWFADQLTKPNGIGYFLRLICVCLGLCILSIYWAVNLAHQCFCSHPNLEEADEDEFVYCEKCGKKIWTPWSMSEPEPEKEKLEPMTALEFLIFLRDTMHCCPMLKAPGTGEHNPSNKELRQWLKDDVVFLNGKFLRPQDIVTFPVESLVFWPNSKRKTTLW